jgi:predicted nucleic acid-binding protein
MADGDLLPRRVLVDTDVWSVLFGNSKSRSPGQMASWKAQLAGSHVVIAAQTRAEVLAGARALGERRAGALLAVLDNTETVPVTEPVIQAYADLSYETRDTGHALHQKQHTGDRWIAATAIAYDMELLSGDGVFAATPGLKLLSA